MLIITTRQQLVDLARELRVREDWHEPDERGLSARVEGVKFDNAGSWPTASVLRGGHHISTRSVELHVIITREHTADQCDECGHAESEDIAAVNVADLLAWACLSGPITE